MCFRLDPEAEAFVSVANETSKKDGGSQGNNADVSSVSFIVRFNFKFVIKHYGSQVVLHKFFVVHKLNPCGWVSELSIKPSCVRGH